MPSSTRRAVVAVLLVGCGVGGGFTGSDPAPLTPDDSPEAAFGTELCPVSDLVATCGPPGRSLTAVLGTRDGITVVDLVHEGVELPGCAPWLADAVPNEDAVISIHYVPGAEDTGDTGQLCDCAWTFTYWVQLRPGTWTFDAMGDEATITVPEY